MILPGLKGGASDFVRARNTGLKDEKGKRIYDMKKNIALFLNLDIHTKVDQEFMTKKKLIFYLQIAIGLVKCRN